MVCQAEGKAESDRTDMVEILDKNMQLFPVIRMCICLKTESVKNPYLCSETH